jgi:hypothetical protein
MILMAVLAGCCGSTFLCRVRNSGAEKKERLCRSKTGREIFEDALAGVEAGKRGYFGCLVRIDRGQQSQRSYANTAPM